jgi:LmbE family N-acetylglucosaminyl deacetylase
LTAPVLHVAAHPDDDLLFMDPDLSAAIRSRVPTVTVYLTAGQLSGDGTTDGERYASRQRGIQDAYARMAGVEQPDWSGDLLPVAGYLMERHTLTGAGVHLVWMALRDGQLASLYAGTPHLTVVPDGGLGAPQYGYNRDDVRQTLTALLALYEPSQVRSLDPLPESRYSPHDHADHTASAQFVADAAPSVPVVPYRGYSISSLPPNLADEVAADKLATFDAYRNGGDHGAAAMGWTERIYYRWPRGTAWVGANADGRLQVFCVRQGVLWTWWQTTTGAWSSPRTLGDAGGPIAPTVAVGRNRDGRLEVYGRRLSDHRIVSVWQTAANGGWSTVWADLGNHTAGQLNAPQMGCPAVTSNGDGRLQVLVKNGGGGVSTKCQTSPGGSWSSWVDLGGTDVQDGVTAITGPAGRIEAFAATRTNVLHWYQTAPNGGFTANPALPSAAPASPPTACLGPDGRLHLVYRVGAQIAVTSQTVPDGGWGQPALSPGPGGHGQVAAVLGAGVVRLYARDGSGGVSTALVDAAGQVGAWAALGGAADVPAAALDAAGRLVVFAVGPTGVVSVGPTWADLTREGTG